MRFLRCCFFLLLFVCILSAQFSVGAYALDVEQSYLNGDPVELYVLKDGVMIAEDLTGYQVLTYFQGRGSTHQSYFTDTLTLDTTYREGYIVIQITLPSGAYLPKNSVFDLSLKYAISTVSSVSAKAVLYGPNYVTAGEPPIVNINTSTNTIEFSEAQNNKSELSVIEIWLTLSGMEWYEKIQPDHFYINSTQFEYMPGMTWETWKDSEYNNLSDYGVSYAYNSSTNAVMIYEPSSSTSAMPLKYNGAPVYQSDLIQSVTYSVVGLPLSLIYYNFDFSVNSISISTLDDVGLQGGILSWIKNIFNSISNLPQNIANKISGFFDLLGDKISNLRDSLLYKLTDLGDSLLDGIRGLFIPSEESITDLKEDFEEILADRFGAVYESSEVIDNFASAFFNQGQVASVAEDSGIIHFPELTVNLVGTPFIFGGWDVDIIPDQFDPIVSYLKIAIDIVCTFAFVNALRKKLEVVLK